MSDVREAKRALQFATAGTFRGGLITPTQRAVVEEAIVSLLRLGIKLSACDTAMTLLSCLHSWTWRHLAGKLTIKSWKASGGLYTQQRWTWYAAVLLSSCSAAISTALQPGASIYVRHVCAFNFT